MAKKHKDITTRAERQASYAVKQKAREKELQDKAEETPEVELIQDEPIEKDMGEMYYMGPTSFSELDQLKETREQAAQVRSVTYDTQDLVWNILNHPMMPAEEKAKAIQSVGSEFGARVTKAAKPIKKDLDILVIEAILAADKRNSKPLEFIGDFISKAKLTAGAENALDDSQFALVRSDGEKKERKYPIHDKAHVRNALARAAQMMAEGGEAAADAKAAMPKIRAAAKKMGIEMSMEKDNNAILIEKDANGDWRWIGWVSNNFIDWDGDIIAEDAHKEYVGWLDKNPDMYPASTTWHMPEMVRKNAVDFATYESGFLIMSGKLEESEAESLLKAKSLTDLGMSHGTFALARDPNDTRVITKYRMYECSDLPLENAANPFTDFEILTKEADMDKTKYLATILGSEEKANAFIQKTGLKKEALEAAGIENKEKQDETPEVPAVPETPVAEAAPAPAATPELKVIFEAIEKQFGMKDLSEAFAQLQETAEKVPLLEALVKDLQGSKEEALVEMLTPPAERYSWMNKARASASDKNVPDDEEAEKLKKQAPGVPEGYWLSQATNSTPVLTQ